MDEKFLAQLFAEFKAAQQQAFALYTQAICQQLDPARFKTDLQRIADAAEKMSGYSSLAVGMLRHAQAAAEAEKMLQSRPLSEGPHPNRAKS